MQAAHEAVTEELECFYAAYEGDEDQHEEVEIRVAELEAAIAALNNPSVAYDPAEIAHAGASVSIDANGQLRVERGFVRPNDEPPVVTDPVDKEAPQAA